MSLSRSIFERFQVPEAEAQKLPVGALVEYFDSIPRRHSYHSITRFKAELERRLHAYDDSTRECVARVVLAEAIEGNFWKPTCKVPEVVTTEVNVQLSRIYESLSSAPAGYYKVGQDNFQKDAGLVRGSLLPLGCGVVDTNSAVWRRPLKVAPIRQRFEFARFYFRAPRGLGPLFQIHTHTEMLGKFHETGWSEAYKLIGDLVQSNPSYKGFFRASWFCDPSVAKISPRLAYIVKEPTSAGAFLCYLGRDQSGSALAKSNTRRELYAKGEYVPKSYMLIWHRKDLLAWCEKVI